MGRLFITGDCHCNARGEMEKLNTAHFNPEGLTKDDILVIMGDAGFVWNNGATEHFWRDWLDNKPWTTFCVLGNHESYDLIEKLPTTTFGGEEVYQVSKSVFYAKSGRIYNLCGKKCLVVNGADSHDIFITDAYGKKKRYRYPHISWWEQEQITEETVKIAKENVAKAGGTVDFVFTHTGGEETCAYLGMEPTVSDIRLSEILNSTIYEKHFCGHYHKDINTPGARVMDYDVMLVAFDEDKTGYF